MAGPASGGGGRLRGAGGRRVSPPWQQRRWAVALGPTVDALVAPVGDGGRAAQVVGGDRLRGGGAGGRRHWT